MRADGHEVRERTISFEELMEAVASLAAHEQEVSEVRREVQAVADALSGELARRYREGLASVDDVLAAAQRREPFARSTAKAEPAASAAQVTASV